MKCAILTFNIANPSAHSVPLQPTPFRLVRSPSLSTALTDLSSTLYHSSHPALSSPLPTFSFSYNSFAPNEQSISRIRPMRWSQLDRPAAGLFFGHLAHLIVKVSGEPVLASAATFSHADTPVVISFRRRPHNHGLPCSEESDQVFIGAPKTQQQCKMVLYMYTISPGDRVPETLGDLYSGSFCAWNPRAMRAVCVWASSMPGLLVRPHCSVVADVESRGENTVQISIDKNMAGKEAAVCSFDL